MTENETWILGLRDKIIEEDDKVLFDEATGCFLSGHLRASYIMSWISIVESLKRRIKLFSNIGDKRATESLEIIEDLEDKNASVDKKIYKEAKSCGIIDSSDFSTVNYLWEQRCLFAHPYTKHPEIDEVKHVIQQSIKLVLGKELLYNREFLTDLSNNIADKPFFLPSDLEVIKDHAIRTISRIPETLHPFFFKHYYLRLARLLQMKKNKMSI